MRIAALLPALALSGTLHAATAYKCVDAHGDIAFQDHPCDPNARQNRLTLPDDPSPPAPVAEQSIDSTIPAPTEETPPSMARVAPPSFYLCTRYDGSRYISDTGQGGSALVPLGVLGVPGRSLSDAYGGSNGIGVSAPGLRTIPHVPAANVPFGGMDTWIDDECHPASPREACVYLRQSLDDVDDKLRRAFSDTEADLKRQRADIEQRLRGC